MLNFPLFIMARYQNPQRQRHHRFSNFERQKIRAHSRALRGPDRDTETDKEVVE